MKQMVIELFEKVGLPDPASRFGAYPYQLSGGMNQRVMIAMAVANNPKLIIADEPTTALDVTIQAQILALLKELQTSEKMGLVFITHDIGVVSEIADRVLVQYASRKVEENLRDVLLNRPSHPYTRALLDSLPERNVGRRLPVVKGSIPPIHDKPAGCVFHPRCGFASELCRRETPVFADGRSCHHPLQPG